MSGFTPGPWLYCDDVPGAEMGYRAIVDIEGTTICNPSPMGAGNARLIAAAPDLLAALEWALGQLDDDLDLDHQDALRAARAALARARGDI
jgi:hypothetical protein